MTERTIRSIISHQNIVTLPPETSVRAATQAMAKHRIGAVPVTETGRLLGIFTERDLVNRVIAAKRDADATRLREVMTANPTTIAVDAPASRALELMRDGGFRHVLVTDADKLVGIVSLRDIPPEHWFENEV